MRKKIVGVMGPGSPSNPEILDFAYRLGLEIARNDWVLLTGGRAAGVMEHASRGAREAGGTVVGILPDDDTGQCSAHVDIAIPTGMGSARNYINILASDFVVACGMGAGTASEVSLAIKSGKKVLLLKVSEEAKQFFNQINSELVDNSCSIDQTVEKIRAHFANS